MPKRSKRSEKGAKESSKHSSKGSRSSKKGSPEPPPQTDTRLVDRPDLAEDLPTGAAVEERGAFAIARCDRCGWQGAARRSRDRARKDLRQHLEDKPKHADHVSLTNVSG